MALFSLAFEGDKEINSYPEFAKMIESYSFHSIQIYEHIPFRPSWPIVFHTAKYTTRILVGPVTIPVFLYDPITLARYTRVLDELTGGRAILGISRGAYAEYMSREAERSIQSVQETVESVDALLSGENYHGRIINIEQNKEGLGWLSGRRVEIYVGTSGPKLISRVTRLSAVKAIVVDNLWNPRYAEQLRSIIDDESEKAQRGDRVQLIARPFTMICSDRAEAERRIIPILKEYLPHLIGDSPMLTSIGVSDDDIRRFKEKGSQIPSKLIENFVALGNPDDIIEQTDRMLKAGVDHICYGQPLGSLPEVIKVLGERVLPYFTPNRVNS